MSLASAPSTPCLICFVRDNFFFWHHLSDPLPLTVGAPQGSILGPVLFTLYTNDHCQVPKHCKTLGYMDETKHFLGLLSDQLHDAISTVNVDLIEISTWCHRNSLLLDPDKTKLPFHLWLSCNLSIPYQPLYHL